MATITRSAKSGGGTNINTGQPLNPTEINDDANTVFAAVNGNLDNTNVATATIPGAKSLRFTEISAPSSPSSDDLLLYAKDNAGTTTLYTKDSAGVETALSVSTGFFPRSYLAGLGLVQAADADHDITVAVGSAKDSTNAVDLTLAATITKRLDASWAVGDAMGGIDTGGIAATTWYHLWLIKRVDTGVVDVLFSLSATAPTMPTNYTVKRRIGSVLTDGASTIVDFVQTGDEFLWLVPALNLSADVTEAATLRTLSVPTGVAMVASVNVAAEWSAVGDNAIYLSPPAQTDQAPTFTSASPLATLYTSTKFVGQGPIAVRTDTSARIRTRVTNTLAGIGLNIATLGWHDRRGRDD